MPEGMHADVRSAAVPSTTATSKMDEVMDMRVGRSYAQSQTYYVRAVKVIH